MIGGRLPDVPDPTKVANSVAEGVKIGVDRGVLIGQTLAEGVSKVAMDTAKSFLATADHVIRDGITGVEVNLGTVKATVDGVKRVVDSAASGIRAQIDAGVGGEIIRKVKADVERQLR